MSETLFTLLWNTAGFAATIFVCGFASGLAIVLVLTYDLVEHGRSFMRLQIEAANRDQCIAQAYALDGLADARHEAQMDRLEDLKDMADLDELGIVFLDEEDDNPDDEVAADAHAKAKANGDCRH